MKTLQAVIVQRFIPKGKDWESFIQSYKEARHASRGLGEPSANDKRIHAALVQYQSVSFTAKKLGTSSARIYGAVARVSAYNKNAVK